MKFTRKRSVFTLFLTLCMAAFLALFVGCSDGSNTDTTPTDTEVTYTVTVKTDETIAASDVKVTISQGSSRFGTGTTDANGKATFTLPEANYTVALSNLPEHYEMPANADLAFTAAKHELTITLARAFAYEVRLVNPDGTPFYANGIQVGICTLTGNCLAPVALGQDGVAYIEAEKSDYHVQILGLEGYIYASDANGYYTEVEFSTEVTQMTITIYPITEMGKNDAKMSEAQKTTQTKLQPSYDQSYYAHTSYEYTANLPTDAMTFFKLTPTITGRYYFFSVSTGIYFYDDGETFSLENDQSHAIQNIRYGYSKALEAGKTYYYKAENYSEEQTTAKLIVVEPVASYVALNNIATTKTFDLTVNSANANAVIAIKPSTAAKFTATVKDNSLTKITDSLSEPQRLSDTTEAADYVQSAQHSVKITTRYLNQYTLYFVVQVKADSYPQTVSVEIKNDGAVVDTNETVTVKETLTKQTAPEGKTLTPVPMDGTAKLEYNESDKTYHLNTADGEQVVLCLTKESRLALGNGFAYIDKNPQISAQYVVIEENSDLTKGDHYIDYREFVRGFKEYNRTIDGKTVTFTIPSTLTQSNCYINFVDENGCYPLTEELKTFVEEIYAANANLFKSNISGGTAEYKWLFACYYYKSETATPSKPDATSDDPIVGEYEFISPAGNKTLTVKDDYTFSITENGHTINGTWAKNSDDDNYSFIDIVQDIPYKVVRDNKGALTFTDDNDEIAYEFAVANSTSEPDPVASDPIIGEYKTVTGLGTITLTVKDDSTFTMANPMGTNNGIWAKNIDNDNYTFVKRNEETPDLNVVYYVKRTAKGALIFYPDDPEIIEPEYEFDVVDSENDADPIIGEYVNGSKTLTVNDNGSFSISDGTNTVTGTWTNNITKYMFYHTADGVYYTVERNVGTGALAFYDILNDEDMEHPVYEFSVKAEESDSSDGE